MKQRIRTRRGVVLLEAVFAIFLVMTAALIVSATMPISNVSRAKANYADKAMDLAQKQIEAIRSSGYSNATPTQLLSLNLVDQSTTIGDSYYPFSNVDSGRLDNPSLILPQGTGAVKLEQMGIDLIRVTVRITWNENGTARTYMLGTLVANL